MAVSNKFIQLQQLKYDLFKSQNLENGRFDVIFEVEGRVLYAHKNMLNLVSETFNAMLSDRWNTKKDEPIKIKNYTYDEFYQFLTFLYSALCHLTEKNIFAMIDIAEFYGVDLFKVYCSDYLSSMKITLQNIFPLMDVADKYLLNQFKVPIHRFIRCNFQSLANSDEFLKLEKHLVQEFVFAVKHHAKPEILFEAVYKWTEKLAMDKQAADPNLKLNDTIKDEFSDFFPHIYFYGMNLRFLEEFVVPRGFIFSSVDELKKMLHDLRSQPKVKVTTGCRQILHGKLIPNPTVIEAVNSLRSMNSSDSDEKGCWWKLKRSKIPSTTSPLKKRPGIKWYLIYFPDDDIGVLHCSLISDNTYLIAELTEGAYGFRMSRGCEIEIEQ